MGESAAGGARGDGSLWTGWSHRLMLVCLAAGVVLAAGLIGPLVFAGSETPVPAFRIEFYAGLGVLAIWMVTHLLGIDVTLPETRPPFNWLTPILLFFAISLRYVLLIETGLFGFLAFPSQWRYLGLFAAIFGAFGILKNIAGALIARRAELRQLM